MNYNKILKKFRYKSFTTIFYFLLSNGVLNSVAKNLQVNFKT